MTIAQFKCHLGGYNLPVDHNKNELSYLCWDQKRNTELMNNKSAKNITIA